jgi:hypothetical protein
LGLQGLAWILFHQRLQRLGERREAHLAER